MYSLPGYLYGRNWQKLEKKTDWAQTSDHDIMNHHQLTKDLTRTLLNVSLTVQTTNNHWQKSWYTNSEQEPLNRCHQLSPTHKRLIHDFKRNWHTSTNNRRIENNSKTTTDQWLQDQRHEYHHLTTTLPLILKMTTAQVVETSVTNNSLSKDYPHPDDHAKQISCRSYQFMHCVLLRYAHVILDMISYLAFLTTV